ncbi:MAG TPA: hypothetical protein VF826_16970 [Chloroflexia bacterium]|jgi:chromosome segregation ATPase
MSAHPLRRQLQELLAANHPDEETAPQALKSVLEWCAQTLDSNTLLAAARSNPDDEIKLLRILLGLDAAIVVGQRFLREVATPALHEVTGAPKIIRERLESVGQNLAAARQASATLEVAIQQLSQQREELNRTEEQRKAKQELLKTLQQEVLARRQEREELDRSVREAERLVALINDIPQLQAQLAGLREREEEAKRVGHLESLLKAQSGNVLRLTEETLQSLQADVRDQLQKTEQLEEQVRREDAALREYRERFASAESLQTQRVEPLRLYEAANRSVARELQPGQAAEQWLDEVEARLGQVDEALKRALVARQADREIEPLPY